MPNNLRAPWLFNWDGQDDKQRVYFANGWPTIRSRVVAKGVRFGTGKIGEDSAFGTEAMLAGFEANAVGKQLGFYSEESGLSVNIGKTGRCSSANETCPLW